MYKKYTLPLSIFVVFENINPVVWTSESFYPNSYILYINKSWFYSINTFFKNEVFLSNSTLLENSAIDNKKSFDFLDRVGFNLRNRILLFYVYYFFTIKTKLLLFTTFNNSNLSKISSNFMFSISFCFIWSLWIYTLFIFFILYKNDKDL